MAKETELFETMSTTSTVDDCPTPTHTSISEGTSSFSGILFVESVPAPNATFVIRHRATRKIMTLLNGEIRLCDGLDPRGGIHWDCVETNRWLGFRNTASGRYIGHDDGNNFIARVLHHRGHEWFCARMHPRGGCELLTRHGDELWSMAISSDGKSLIKTKGEGALWDFLKTW